MDILDDDANHIPQQDSRRFQVYFRINNQDPFVVGGLELCQYLAVKHNPKKARELVQTHINNGTVIVENLLDDLIIYMSLDNVEFFELGEEMIQGVEARDGSGVKKLAGCTEKMASSSELLDDPEVINVADEKEKRDTLKKCFRNKKVLNRVQSRAWKFFDLTENPGIAKCRLCFTKIKTSGNTSNLNQHIKERHPLLWVPDKNFKSDSRKRKISDDSSSNETCDSNDEISESSWKKFHFTPTFPKIDEKFNEIKTFADGGKQEKEITDTLLFMIARDKQSLSIVEKQGFIKLIKKLKPQYQIPKRDKITRLVESRYLELKEILIHRVKNSISYSLTCDIWTDISTQSYLGITIHHLSENVELSSSTIGVFPLDDNHTADNLSECIDEVIEDFQLSKNKILCIVTDSAANIKAAIRKSFSETKHVGCFAHMLSHPKVEHEISKQYKFEAISKIKAIVTYFRKSVVASDELKKLQMRDGKVKGDCLKLLQSTDTRWNSTFYMIKRFLLLEEYIYPVICKCKSKTDKFSMVTMEELEILKDLVIIMEIIENAIREISGDTYPTCSIAIPMAHCMELKLNETQLESNYGNDFKKKMLLSITELRKTLEGNLILCMSTVLDPRFKKVHFFDKKSAANAIRVIDDIIKKNSPLEPKIKDDEKFNVKESSTFWNAHDKWVQKYSADADNYEEKLSELRLYLTQPLQARKENPFVLWKNLQNSFPELYKVAIRYIGLLCTSVPSERMFSQAGDIVSKKRSRLTGEHVKHLLFLSSMPEKDWNLH